MNIRTLSLTQWKFRPATPHASADAQKTNEAFLSEKIWLDAQVPGTIHEDLHRNGLIAHPFEGTNEHRQQWIDKTSWHYTSSFQLSEDMLDMPRLELVLEGLDTYADVYLNEQLLLSADNMFLAWTVDVLPFAKAGDNELLIVFHSPVDIDLPKATQLGYPLPASNDQSELGELGDNKISIFARKAPYHYGWDWGPRFVTCGIWRPAYIRAWQTARFADLHIQQRSISQERAELAALAQIDCVEAGDYTLTVSVDGQVFEQAVSLQTGQQTLTLELALDNPNLWWPRGHGAPDLYTFTATLNRASEACCTTSVRTGLRTVKLVTDKDERGSSFYFEINGNPIFAKGANHIPNDSFLPAITNERYRHEIASAVEANMNMLRVWGGGIYEEKIFYELCDEHGIMVWQDFMFACSMYPGDDAFLENVRKEAAHNLVQLRNHACIVLWCGNNEIDVAWSHYNEDAGWDWKQLYSDEQRTRLWNDYKQIFHHILPDAVSEFQPSIPYRASSPLAEESGDIHQHSTNDATHGDIHYWGVWHSIEPFEAYNTYIGRFMSEYGFQSFPEWSTVLRYASTDDLRIDSEVMLAHQKNGRGNFLIKEYMDMYLPHPRDFAGFLYLSQVLQAEAMKTAIEAHRRSMPYCMGSLYWQMNDCWPVASWSGIDYYGRWKALHYYLRHTFADVLLTVKEEESGQLTIHLVNDHAHGVAGQLSVELLTFNGESKQREQVSITAPGGTSTVIWTALTDNWLKQAYDRSELVLAVTFEDASGQITTAHHYFSPWKELQAGAGSEHIQVTEVPGSAGSKIMLHTDRLALKVRLTSDTAGIFSDNYFDLLPGRPRTIAFRRRCVEGGAAAFEAAAPAGLGVHAMADFV